MYAKRLVKEKALLAGYFPCSNGNNIIDWDSVHFAANVFKDRQVAIGNRASCPWQQHKLKVKTWGHQIFVTPCSSDNPGMFSSGNIWNQILPSLVKVIQIKLTYLTLFKFCLSPRFELPVKDEGGEKKSMNIVCHYCNQPGHKASSCPANPHKENFKVSGAYCTPYFLVYVKFEFESLSENN